MTKTGMVVKAIITDGLAKNKAAMDILGASEDNSFFFINGFKIYTVFDVHHLLKCLRNALLKYILLLPDGSLIKFAYIAQFVRMDMLMQPRLVEKVTETHLEPNNFQKMSVPLAAQVIHKKVAAKVMTYAALGALPVEAMATGRFLEKIANCFDSFNGITKEENSTPQTFKCAMTDETGQRPPSTVVGFIC